MKRRRDGHFTAVPAPSIATVIETGHRYNNRLALQPRGSGFVTVKAINNELARRGAEAVLTIAYDLSPRPRLAARNCDIISVDPERYLGSCFLCDDGYNMERNETGSGTTPTLQMPGEHRLLTGAGWSYRTNDRGWIIYRDPQTGRWHTLNGALSVLRSELSVAAPPKLAS